MEVMADPVPLLLEVEPRLGIDAVVRKIQGYTAHTIGKEYPWMTSRVPSLWTRWRLMASVGAVSLEGVKQDIEQQKGK
jgi:putative transposase